MNAGWTQTVGRVLTLAKAGRSALKMRRAASAEARGLARARLAEVLGDARGLAMKVGQLAATEDAADPLRPLITSVDPLPLSSLRPQIEQQLGHALEETFQALDESCAAASLGQVHHGLLRDGREVAVKVRYPGVGAAVKSELLLAGLLPGVGPVSKWGFDLSGYKRVLSENMSRELDYRSEATRQAEFARTVQVRGLVVPHVYHQFSREGLLVQSWETGKRLHEAGAWPKRERLELGRALLETLFVSLFRAGLVHGDPHPGNYLVRPAAERERAELVLLDYGCTISVSAEARTALLHLILKTREGGAFDAFSSFASLGFSPHKLAPLEDALRPLCIALFRPFLVEGAFRVSDWALGAAMDEACGELKWWFRSAGPPELFLLLRAFQGVCQHLTALDVALPWWPLLKHAVGEELLAEARAFKPRALPSCAHRSERAYSRLLRVCVEEGAKERVNLTFPAREALSLRTIMPAEVQARIAQRGIELAAIEEQLGRTGLAPGPVFEDCDGGRRFRIWLE